MNYWMVIDTPEGWQRWQEFDQKEWGHKKYHWPSLQKTRPGDYFLCYVTRLSRFAGILEIMSAPCIKETPRYEGDVFPCRVRVKPVRLLPPERGVPIQDLGIQGWRGLVRRSLRPLSELDAEKICRALREAQEALEEKAKPVPRPA